MSPSNPIALTIILIFGIQAIVLVVLILKKRPIKQSNIFLALILFFFALMPISLAVAKTLYILNKSHLIRYFELELLFGIGPSLYFFTKSITDPDYRIQRKEYIHFIPVILEFIYYRTNIFQNGLDYRMAFYEKGLTSIYQIPLEPLSLIYIILQWLAIASVITYIFLSVRLFHRYRIWVKSNYSNLTSKSLGWLKTPLFLYSAFWISWIILRLIDTFVFQDNLGNFYLLPSFIGMSAVTCWLGFKGYVKAQIDAVGFSKEPLTVKSKPANPEAAKELTKLMLNQKPYLDPELDLLKLSDMIDMNSKIVSQIINTDLKMNFHEFINKHRVEEFKNRLQDQDSSRFSLMGIAYECGFNSKSTFNHVFKKITGQTPSEYKNQL